MQTTSCTWPYVVPIGEDPAAHGHWCAFTDLYHTMPWVCYRRRNQWLRLALALFCLPLIWLACVVYLLVCVAEGWGGLRVCVYPCAVLGYAMLRYSVGVGVGVMRVSGRCFVALLARRVFIKIVNYIWDRWLWRGRCLVVS